TITDINRLKEVLIEIRENEYSINNQELEIGLRSAAAPIRDEKGEVIAAINISMSSARISSKELEEKFIPILIKIAKQISFTLGHR
ncbi:IclR family transcriptional regulator, partial [bacterium]|nr:IclR family transcriptional regulator [bacterium]